ncbi:YesL family protein [Aquibacillus albus]|uniref:Membrane protein YesL n=1 Tax=Aquibacillus albus TaxID=1168171 RepID=A0ABS2MWZ8_9BACI|nr:DUF624 domain-containing protein [Aquibacillus albus]MBM7570410.1 putative membrane protein YesL [Aquibacillus albus]
MNIFSVDSRFFKLMEVLTNFFLLNLLWIVMCIPIVTIFPATSAMFGVVRQWVLKKDSSVFRSFFQLFKENFKTSIIIGVLWFLISGLLILDIYFAFTLGSTTKFVLLPVLLVIGFLFLLTSTFLFPVIVHYQLKWNTIIKNSFLLGVSHFHVVLISFLITIAMLLTFVYLPILVLVIFSIGSYFTYKFCHRTFEKIENKQEEKASL